MSDKQIGRFEQVDYGDTYTYIDIHNGEIKICNAIDEHSSIDTNRFLNNNYFHTDERGKEIFSELNRFLKTQRLHDEFCCGYVPDWNNENIRKYYVYYDHTDKQYYSGWTVSLELGCSTYFPTKQIADKVCEILNTDSKNGG